MDCIPEKEYKTAQLNDMPRQKTKRMSSISLNNSWNDNDFSKLNQLWIVISSQT